MSKYGDDEWPSSYWDGYPYRTDGSVESRMSKMSYYKYGTKSEFGEKENIMYLICNLCGAKIERGTAERHNAIHEFKAKFSMYDKGSWERLGRESLDPYNRIPWEPKKNFPAIEEVLKKLKASCKTFDAKEVRDAVEVLSSVGWTMDISEGINADGKRGFIISMVEK